MSNNSTNNTDSLSNDTTNQNNSHGFRESVNISHHESNNRIFLYAMDAESGNTNLVTIPL